MSCMEEESISDDINGLAYDSVLTVAESLRRVSSQFDFNLSDFDPLDVSDPVSRQIGEAIRNSTRSISFDGYSVRLSIKMMYCIIT